MAYNTIKLKKYVDIIEEYEAAAAILPGNLLELTSAGKVQKHSTAGGSAPVLIALEDELQGKGISDAYAAGDRVQVGVFIPGEQAYVRAADEVSFAVGDFVESNGLGQLRKRTEDSAVQVVVDKTLVGQVLVALDTTSLSTDESEVRPTEQLLVLRIV